MRWQVTSLVMLAWLAPMANAAAQGTWREVTAILTTLAFDPEKLFETEGDRITVAYGGADMNGPVFALAVQHGCLSHEARSPACGSRVTARMVRAPDAGSDRPRARGALLQQRLRDRQATTASQIAENLGPAGVQWLEADLGQCPAAAAILARSNDAEWVPKELYDREKADVVIVTHADSVKVSFRSAFQRSSHQGYVAAGSPAQWAVDLSEALEPCWRPATAVPPWLR